MMRQVALHHRVSFLKALGQLVVLSTEKTIDAKVVSEFKSIRRLKVFQETGCRSLHTTTMEKCSMRKIYHVR